ncbi:MAG: DUF72 domain-containing protein [Opitutaceae bacterium]|nr:DUF72 domain-containing protein [Cytophagales bacterium]
MNFGKVENPGEINFILPPDNPDTKRVLSTQKQTKKLEVFVGCAKWNKKDLKNFYPKGTKDELTYYSSQFNSIELNGTFYNSPTKEQVLIWKQKSAEGFKFFPKINQSVSHYRRLDQVKPLVEDFCEAVSLFEEKLGMVFLQMHDKFGIKNYERVEKFVKEFPSHIPLALEVRNADWFKEKTDADRYFYLLEENNITNIIVDTAGRRDMLHMRLTGPTAFIRYVGANHESDYPRLDEWVTRLKKWKEEGLQELYFFVHQNVELESPLLSAYFIEQLNKELGLDLKIPDKAV